MKQATFYLANMCCSSEERVVRKHLSGMAGVTDLKFQVMERRLTVEYQLEDERPIFQALEKLGMGPRLQVPTSPEPRARHPFFVALAFSGGLAAACEILALRGAPESSALVVGLALLSMVLSGRQTFAKGWSALRSLTFNMNFLMSTAILGAMLLGEWPEAAMVTCLFSVAETVEGYSLERARNAIRSLMELSPEKATLLSCCGHESVVPAAQVALGKRVRVKPGERIPLDGTVVAVVPKEGQTVNANQSAPTIVKLARLDTMLVKAEVSEADVVKVQPGQTV